MNTFRIRAYTDTGEVVEHTIAAASKAEALKSVDGSGLRPFAVQMELGGARRRKTVSGSVPAGLALARRAAIYRELGSLLAADIAIDQAVGVMAANAANKDTARLIRAIGEAMAGGASLSEALGGPEIGFPQDEISIIAAGEYSGSVIPVLADLAHALESRDAIQKRIRSALAYPLFLLAMSVAAVVVLAFVLAPNIAPLFTNMQIDPPLMIRMLLGLRHLLLESWMVLLVIIAAGALVLRGITGRGARSITPEDVMCWFPVFGSLVRLNETTRFCRAFGMLLRGGVPLLQALRLTRTAMHTKNFRAATGRIAEAVEKGERFCTVLSQNDLFPDQTRRLVVIGEDTNRLEDMLAYAADRNQALVEYRLDRIIAVLAPALTLAIGGAVGALIISTMDAILSVNELAF